MRANEGVDVNVGVEEGCPVGGEVDVFKGEPRVGEGGKPGVGETKPREVGV